MSYYPYSHPNNIEAYQPASPFSYGDALYMGAISSTTGPIVTCNPDNYVYLCDATSAPISVRLPDLSLVLNRNISFIIKKVDASVNLVTLDGHSGDTFDGDLTVALADQFTVCHVLGANTSEWTILNKLVAPPTGGGISSVTTQTGSSYTATSADDVILCNSAVITISLPPAALNANKVFYIKNIHSTGIVTVDPFAGDTVDGNSTIFLSTQWATYTILSNGTTWNIL